MTLRNFQGHLRFVCTADARSVCMYIFVQVALYSVIVVTSLVGNGGVICIVWREKHMRKATNYFLVNLAACDVIVTSLCTWVHLVGDLTHDWLLGAFFCKLNSFVQGEVKKKVNPLTPIVAISIQI